MIRGTTPVVTLRLPMEITFDVLFVTFKQGNEMVLEKSKSEVQIEGAAIIIPLSQQETLRLHSNYDVRVQLRGKVGEIAYASKIVRFSVSDLLKDGEI